jgi:hypothetical protein
MKPVHTQNFLHAEIQLDFLLRARTRLRSSVASNGLLRAYKQYPAAIVVNRFTDLPNFGCYYFYGQEFQARVPTLITKAIT